MSDSLSLRIPSGTLDFIPRRIPQQEILSRGAALNKKYYPDAQPSTRNIIPRRSPQQEILSRGTALNKKTTSKTGHIHPVKGEIERTENAILKCIDTTRMSC
jgi:hypothetical protein